MSEIKVAPLMLWKSNLDISQRSLMRYIGTTETTERKE